jgi:class 3 adenylate cyclase/pSer/pThr/pTyr-binding forkhead associated (FHA) protein
MDEPSSNRIEDLIRERLRLDQELDRFQQMLTILYVDIVGSTRFYDEYGNTAGLVMVQKCLDLLIPMVERQHGIVVKTIGDAILARWDTVEDAVRCGVEMVRGLEQRNRGRVKNDEIHIHVGINYGLCLLKDNDVFGDVVNVAARIEGAAGIDEIVVSPSVYEKLRNVPEFRIKQKSSGVELKGKSAKLDLYTVRWRDEPGMDFLPSPPPPTAEQLILASGVHKSFSEMQKQLANSPVAPAKAAPKALGGPRAVKFSLARVRPDGNLERTYVLDRPGMTAGHAGDIALTDPSLAAQHVRFTQFSDQLFVEDLGSAGGVYTRLRAAHLLQHGDIFQIGQQWFRFTLDDVTRPSTNNLEQTALFRPEPGTKKLRAVLVRMDEQEKELARYDLPDTETLLGRSRGMYTFPEDPYLSSLHAKVTDRDGKYYLEDVGSTNGTYLRIRKRAFAQEGDTLLIGKQSFRVLADRDTKGD